MDDQKKKIFITGATGFFGRHLILDSSLDHFTIFILTRNRKDIESDPVFKDINILEGDIMEIEKFSGEIGLCDYFIHLAGEKSDVSRMQQVNADSMHKILTIVSSVKGLKFIYLSSSGVYGIYNHPENILKEESDCFPDSIYEKTKFAAESALTSFSGNNPLRYIILRPSNVFGEYDQSHKLLNLMRKLKSGHFFYLNKNAIANYVYVKYVTSAILHFLKTDNFNNQIYNVNSPVKLNNLIDVLLSELKIKRQPKKLPGRLIQLLSVVFGKLPLRFRILDKEKYFALSNTKFYSNEKLKSEMRSEDDEFLNTGIHNLVNWYRNNNLL